MLSYNKYGIQYSIGMIEFIKMRAVKDSIFKKKNEYYFITI